MKNFQTKARLSVMNFLEFAVWGAYLISMGMFLANNGLGEYVFWFYTVQGLVSIVMPALIGIVADRWIPAQMPFTVPDHFRKRTSAAISVVTFPSIIADNALENPFLMEDATFLPVAL